MICKTEILDCLPMKCDEAVINTSDAVCNMELCKFVTNEKNMCQVHPTNDNATLCHVFTAFHQSTDYFSACYISNPNHTEARCPADLAINYNVTISEAYSLSTYLTVENITTNSSDLHPRTNQTALCTCPCDKTTTKSPSLKNMFKLIVGTVLKLKAVLAMDVKNTSRARMRKECARDNRPSSVIVGVVGVAIICVPLGLLVISDLSKLYAESRKMIKNVGSAFK